MDNNICSCIKGLFDVTIDIIDRDRIMVTDLSEWMEDGPYNLPDDFEISIMHPNRKDPYVVSIKPKTSVVVTIDDLSGDENMYFVDGVYCVTTESCGTSYTKFVALTRKLDCCIEKLLASAELKRDFEFISEIKDYRSVIHSSISLGMVERSREVNKIANRKIRDMRQCDC